MKKEETSKKEINARWEGVSVSEDHSKDEFPLEPCRGKVIITLNTIEIGDDELQEEVESLDDIQRVVAAAANSWLSPGDKVILDLEKLTVKHSATNDAFEENGRIMLDPVEVDGVVYGFINEGVVKAKYNR